MALPADHPDVQLARRVSDEVRANRDAGRAFYAEISPEFRNRFQQNAKGIYRYLIRHPAMPRVRPDGTPADDDDKRTVALTIVNKTYYNALRGIAGYRGDGTLTAWFYVIARDALVDELRVTLRRPDVRRRLSFESRDTLTEADSARGAVLEAEAAVTMTVDEDDRTSELMRRLLKELRIVVRAGNDPSGRPYLTQEELDILRAYATAHGDIEALAKIVNRNILAVRGLVQSALTSLQRAVDQLARGPR